MRNLETLALLAALLLPRSTFAGAASLSERVKIAVHEELCEHPELPVPCRVKSLFSETVGVELSSGDDGRLHGEWQAKLEESEVSYHIVVEVSGVAPDDRGELSEKQYKIIVFQGDSKDPLATYSAPGPLKRLDWRGPAVELSGGGSSTLEITLSNSGVGGDNPYPRMSGANKH